MNVNNPYRPADWQDAIITRAEIAFSFWERIRILFGASVTVSSRVDTEHVVGATHATSTAWLSPSWFRRKARPDALGGDER